MVIPTNRSSKQKTRREPCSQTVKLEDKNLTQMKFPEIKIEDKIELQIDEENRVDFEVFILVLKSLRQCDKITDHIYQKERQYESLTNQDIVTTESEIKMDPFDENI